MVAGTKSQSGFDDASASVPSTLTQRKVNQNNNNNNNNSESQNVTSAFSKKKAGSRKQQRGEAGKNWGEWGGFDGEFGGQWGSLFLGLFLPTLPFLFYASCTHYECQLVPPVVDLLSGKFSVSDLYNALPTVQPLHWVVFIGWILFQAFLAVALPGKWYKGVPTPTGNILDYKINALPACLVTMATYILGASYFKWYSLTFIYDNWGPLVSVGTIAGYVLTFFFYFKGRYFPTNEDTSYHGKLFYDLWMGTELNPRFGNFDIKIFSIGRVAMIGWALVLISFVAKQYEMYGYVANSLALVTIFELIYIIDWAWKEAWYLATLDIMHDHFGFFLTYGSTCWVKAVYSIPGWFLVHYPIHISHWIVGVIVAMQLLGYVLFRLTNNQKLSFRASGGNTTIWGKPAVGIKATYTTTDNETRTSLLLASGFWGLARHFNYLCDLLHTAAICLCCGVAHFMPWNYMLFMLGLLLNRAYRDDRRCRAKYGEAWDEYCRRVPYIIIPGIY